jgi:hypothetical protein
MFVVATDTSISCSLAKYQSPVLSLSFLNIYD